MVQQSQPMTDELQQALLAKSQYFVDCKYVARSDARQKEMGLAYVEAERQDLAREIARFAEGHNAALRAKVDELTAFIEFWTYTGRLQTFEDRERFRKAAALAVNSQEQP